MIKYKDFPDTTTSINAKELNKLLYGWFPVSDSDCIFTYTSSTRIATSADLTSIIQKGDKIKYTQSTVKYSYVIAITSTYIDVTGGTDYTVANEPITEFYFSHEANPVGCPRSFNYISTTTLGTMVTLHPTNRLEVTRTADGIVILNITFLTNQQLTNGTHYIIATLPAAVRPSGNLALGSHLADGIICRAYIRSNGELVYIPYGTIANGGEIGVIGSYTV